MTDRVHLDKRRLQYYTLESFVYRVSDHSPKKFYKRTNYGGREILSVEEGRR